MSNINRGKFKPKKKDESPLVYDVTFNVWSVWEKGNHHNQNCGIRTSVGFFADYGKIYFPGGPHLIVRQTRDKRVDNWNNTSYLYKENSYDIQENVFIVNGEQSQRITQKVRSFAMDMFGVYCLGLDGEVTVYPWKTQDLRRVKTNARHLYSMGDRVSTTPIADKDRADLLLCNQISATSRLEWQKHKFKTMLFEKDEDYKSAYESIKYENILKGI